HSSHWLSHYAAAACRVQSFLFRSISLFARTARSSWKIRGRACPFDPKDRPFGGLFLPYPPIAWKHHVQFPPLPKKLLGWMQRFLQTPDAPDWTNRLNAPKNPAPSRWL